MILCRSDCKIRKMRLMSCKARLTKYLKSEFYITCIIKSATGEQR